MENPYIINFNRVESSYTYDMLLSGLEGKSYSISQSISPNGVDRFKIKLANSFGDPIMPAIYKFSILIMYNEGNLNAESEEMIVPIPSIEECTAYYIQETVKEKAKKNYINLKRFYEGNVVKSEHFLSIYDSYEKNKTDFLS